MKQYNGSKGNASVTTSTRQGRVTTGTFVAEALFEKGTATIECDLVQVEGQWRVSRFKVNASV